MKIISLCLYSITIFLLNLSIIKVNGQVRTPCTTSFIKTFTPCFNFITGSSSRSGSSSSPTKNCCNSMKSFVSSNKDCACLIVTGNVPISIPFIGQNLAISLPRICNGGVPIECKATGVPLPPPGPALFAPPPPAIAPSVEAPSDSASPTSGPKPTRASKAITLPPAPPPAEKIIETSPADSPSESLPPATHTRIKPVLNPNSASSPPSHMLSQSILIMTVIIVLKFY